MFERLLVHKENTDDNSVVNLSTSKMREMRLGRGDVVLLQGKHRNETVAVVMPGDCLEPSHIKISQSAMLNLEASPADKIRVSRVSKVEYGSKIHVLPFDDHVGSKTLGILFTQYLKPYFELAYRPVMMNNVFGIDGPNGLVEFKVMSVTPEPLCVVSPNTIIFCHGNPVKREDMKVKKSSEVSFKDVGGCQECIDLIREVVELPLLYPEIYISVGIKAPKGILMYGPPGTGKTLIARAIAAETRAHFLLINGPELMSKFVGESENNLRKVFHEATQSSPSIVFIDELDAIVPKRNKSCGEMEKRMVAQLLTLMDGLNQRENVIVIAATNQPGSIDTALRRCGRFEKEIEIGLPNCEGRLEILKIHTRKMKLADDVDLGMVASQTHGFSGSDLEGLCVEAACLEIKGVLGSMDWKEEDIDLKLFENLKVTFDKFEKAQNNITPSGLREMMVEIPKVTWAEVAGLDEVKEQLMEIIQFPVAYPKEFNHFDLTSSKGVLLFGPPGCGKTLMAKAFANECGINFISIKGSDIVSMWFGESENNVKDLFIKARSCQPCILFFDEIDCLGKMRGGQNNSGGAEERIVNQLLVEMDGIQENKQVFVIGATNRPDTIDPALLRPGRIDQIIYIPLPDFKTRFILFQTNLSKTPIEKSVNMATLAKRCQGYSGADIAELIRKAKHLAMKDAIVCKNLKNKKLTKGHFDEALQHSYRSVSDQDASMYDAIFESLRKGNGVKRRSNNRDANDAVTEDYGFYS